MSNAPRDAHEGQQDHLKEAITQNTSNAPIVSNPYEMQRRELKETILKRIDTHTTSRDELDRQIAELQKMNQDTDTVAVGNGKTVYHHWEAEGDEDGLLDKYDLWPESEKEWREEAKREKQNRKFLSRLRTVWERLREERKGI
jgi:hypothetical protein